MERHTPWTEEFYEVSSDSDMKTNNLETLNTGLTDAETNLELPVNAPLSPRESSDNIQYMDMERHTPWTEEFYVVSSDSDMKTNNLETLNTGLTDAETNLELPVNASLSPRESSDNFQYMAMEKHTPWTEEFYVVSSDKDTETSNLETLNAELTDAETKLELPANAPLSPRAVLMRRAEAYQEYMKNIPVPMLRGSVIPFGSWMELGRSLKELYGQPLHYLTMIILKQWDQVRIDSEDKHTPLDFIIHPQKAEAAIWIIEEIHRRTSSHHAVAKQWLSDPMHHAFVDTVIPRT